MSATRHVPLAFLAACLALAGCRGPVSDAPIVAVRTGDFEDVLLVPGRLAAKETVSVQSGTQGKISFMAPEGTVVKQGDPLFGLETKEIEDQLQQALLDLAVSEAGLSKATEEARTTQVKNGLSLKEKQSQLAFDKLAADKARDDLAKKKRQVENKILPRAELAAAELATQQADLTVANSEIELERLHEEMASGKQTLEFDRRSAAARLEKTKTQVQEARDFLSKATVTSPRDGIVTHARNWRGQSWTVGDQVWQGVVVMEIPDLSAMRIEMDVNEVDIARLKVAMPARITVEAFPDARLAGKVSEMSGLATEVKDSDGNGTGVRVFATKVALDAQDERLRPGMTARVAVVLDSRPGVLLVPAAAVRHEAAVKGEERDVVTLASGETREVKVAASSTEEAVIASGLVEGDRVALTARPAGASGSSGPAAGASGKGPAAPPGEALARPHPRPAAGG